MAGHVPRRLLKQPEVDECLLSGTKLWKWEEVCVCVWVCEWVCEGEWVSWCVWVSGRVGVILNNVLVQALHDVI